MAAIVPPAPALARAVAIAAAMAARLASGAVRVALWPVTEAVAAAEVVERRDVMRQRDSRERQLLAQVRHGDPTNYIAEKDRRGQPQVIDGDVAGRKRG